MTKDELFLMRRKKGLTLTRLAKKMKCSVSLLSMFENDKAEMSKEKRQLYEKCIKRG